jgi:hypothetical protein
VPAQLALLGFTSPSEAERKDIPSPCILAWGGGVAQSVERYVRNVEVGGSSPLTSTEWSSQKTIIMFTYGCIGVHAFASERMHVGSKSR